MLNSLPATIDPIRLADEGARLTGSIPVRALRRLAGITIENGAEVQVDLQFERTAQGQREMHGRISARVALACQRCLEPLTLDITAAPLLLFARAGEPGAGLPEDTEQVVVSKPLVLSDLVEDELLLALPMVPTHAETECRTRGYQPVAGAAAENERTGPFASLGRLKKRNDT